MTVNDIDLTGGGALFDYGEVRARHVQIDATGTPDTFQWSDDGGSTFAATGGSTLTEGEGTSRGGAQPNRSPFATGADLCGTVRGATRL